VFTYMDSEFISTISDLESNVHSFARRRDDIWTLTASGVTRTERQILALVDRDAYNPITEKVRVLLVGGLSGVASDVSIAIKALSLVASSTDKSLFSKLAISAIPCANPGGLSLNTGPSNGAGGFVNIGYPPSNGFFNHPMSPEIRYLWRWICYQAPDLVIEIQADTVTGWEANGAAGILGKALEVHRIVDDDSLIGALAGKGTGNLGSIPGIRLKTTTSGLAQELRRFWSIVTVTPPGKSEARIALDRRRSRTPIEVGRDLEKTNGLSLDPLVYTQGVAISGRLRLSVLDPDGDRNLEDITRLIEPVISDPGYALGGSPQAPELAALVWAEELASLTSDPRYKNALVVAANYIQSHGDGLPARPLDQNYIVEDFFFASAVLGRAYEATKDLKYINLMTEFLISAGTQEESGLFSHSRLGKFHWGRGNGFAALGLAEAITYMPDGYVHRQTIKNMFAKQMERLQDLQEPSGMYLQVIDFPGSYQELTATCMIGLSMVRGIRRGWLDNSYRSTVELAWQAVSERIDSDGNVVDGCTGTGVMDSLRSYLDRPANSGYDDRTGSMALWFAAEMAELISQY